MPDVVRGVMAGGRFMIILNIHDVLFLDEMAALSGIAVHTDYGINSIAIYQGFTWAIGQNSSSTGRKPHHV
jgi:hypothetical protein